MWFEWCLQMGAQPGLPVIYPGVLDLAQATGVTVWSELVLSAVSCEIVVRPSSCWS